MTACLPPKNSSLNVSDLDGLARRDDLDLEVVGGIRHALRGEDAGVGALLEDAAHLIGRPVVGVLVRDHDRDDVGEVRGSEEHARVDDDALVADGQQQAGVFVLGDAHEATLPPLSSIRPLWLIPPGGIVAA